MKLLYERPSWIVAFLVVTLTSLGAFAQEPAKAKGPTPKVFQLPTQGINKSISSIIPERVGEQVRAAVKQDRRIETMPTYEEIRKKLGGSGHASAVIAEAEGLYTSGIGLLTAGEDQKAAEAFQRSVDLMEQNFADVSNFAILADALSNLALAYHNSGFEVDANKRMAAFAHVRPTAKLDPEKYPKELIATLKKAQKKVAKGGPGVLQISANIKGAKIFIDGVEKGVTPAKVTDVGFGHHYLLIRGPKGETYSEKIRVKGRKKTQKMNVELSRGKAVADAGKAGAGTPSYYTDLLETISTGRFGTDLQPYTKELSKETGAEYVTWIVMYKDQGKYNAIPFAYRASDGRIVQGDPTQFNIELSDLRVGVAALSKNVVDLTLEMAEERAISSVILGPAPVIATASPTADIKDVPPADTEVAGTKKATVVKPPPSEENNTWTYVAAGGAVLLVGAVIAGGIYLLADDDNPDEANGFNAVVSW